ncbi:MAG TPA: serine/threonine-protein kinase, partial [Labilithrix sp.]|nr:serine/threonine-protein kinase [Labilithrix sp.]
MSFEEQTPDKIGRYEIVLQIARGGMATVYLARSEGHGGFDRYVALKHTAEHLRSDPYFAEHLVEEAKLVAHLRHPNVVPVLDVGVDERGAVFLVMEYVPGDSLGGLLRAARESKVPLPPRVGLRILLDALAGLHAAHEHADEDGNSHHIVHRDFSPQNILVGTDGVARLTDFGIAKATSRVSFSVAGTMKGKVSYASPEQARGRSVDRRCDVWAAAVVAWEIIAGHKLYPPTPRTLIDIVERPPPRLRTVVADVPQEIDDAIAQSLQLDAAERPASAQAFARMLSAAARDANMLAEIDEVAAYVQRAVGPELEERKHKIAETRRQRSIKPSAFPHGSSRSPFVSSAPLPPLPDIPLTEAPVTSSSTESTEDGPLGHQDGGALRALPDPAAPDRARARDRVLLAGQRALVPAWLLEKRRLMVIGAAAGAVVLLVIVIAALSGGSSDADATVRASASASAAGGAALPAPPGTNSSTSVMPSLGAPEPLPPQLEITANLPIARVHVGDRVVDMEV